MAPCPAMHMRYDVISALQEVPNLENKGIVVIAPKVEIYTKAFCGYCHRARRCSMARASPIPNMTWAGKTRATMLERNPGAMTVPQNSLATPHRRLRRSCRRARQAGRAAGCDRRMTKIGILQMTSGADPEANGASAEAIVRTSGGAAMLFTPEWRCCSIARVRQGCGQGANRTLGLREVAARENIGWRSLPCCAKMAAGPTAAW